MGSAVNTAAPTSRQLASRMDARCRLIRSNSIRSRAAAAAVRQFAQTRLDPDPALSTTHERRTVALRSRQHLLGRLARTEPLVQIDQRRRARAGATRHERRAWQVVQRRDLTAGEIHVQDPRRGLVVDPPTRLAKPRASTCSHGAVAASCAVLCRCPALGSSCDLRPGQHHVGDSPTREVVRHPPRVAIAPHAVGPPNASKRKPAAATLRVGCAARLSWWNRLRGRIVAALAAAADPDRKPSRFERLMNLLPPF
jgi:hypothetical protein